MPENLETASATPSDVMDPNALATTSRESEVAPKACQDASADQPSTATDESVQLLGTTETSSNGGPQQSETENLQPESKATTKGADQIGVRTNGLADRPGPTVPDNSADPHEKAGCDRINGVCMALSSQLASAGGTYSNFKTVSGALFHIVNLEERLARLEAQGGKLEEKGGNAKAKLDDRVIVSTDNVLREIRCYDADDDIDRNLFFESTFIGGGGSTSSSNPLYLIQVLCEWSEDSPLERSQSMNLNAPQPHEIDILAFGVLSKPVAEFCGNRLNLSCGPSSMVRFVKPFRPLILNLRELKRHLSILEAKFRWVCPLTM